MAFTGETETSWQLAYAQWAEGAKAFGDIADAEMLRYAEDLVGVIRYGFASGHGRAAIVGAGWDNADYNKLWAQTSRIEEPGTLVRSYDYTDSYTHQIDYPIGENGEAFQIYARDRRFFFLGVPNDKRGASGIERRKNMRLPLIAIRMSEGGRDYPRAVVDAIAPDLIVRGSAKHRLRQMSGLTLLRRPQLVEQIVSRVDPSGHNVVDIYRLDHAGEPFVFSVHNFETYIDPDKGMHWDLWVPERESLTP